MSPQRPTPRIIPVLDVMGGQVVRAIGGRREQYQPVMSKLTTSCAPVDVLTALVEQAKAFEVYIADLDAITGNGRLSPILGNLIEQTQSRQVFWIDVGLRSRESLMCLPYRPDVWPVIAFETAGPEAATEMIDSRAKDDEFAFSLDLRDGELLGDWRAWGLRDKGDGLGLARRVVDLGVRTLIVLDLARVGTGTGAGTEPLLNAIRNEFPTIDLIAGGGVKDWTDIDRLGAAGADAVLIASALHDGTIRLPRPVS
jgi:phosphoribosylformimino-5-aminoimidazole carboxamide ribotide isomerase